MPLTAEQQAALAALVTGEDAPLKGATPEDIATGFRTAIPAAHTFVFNQGNAASPGQDGKAVKKIQKRLTEVETERDALKAQIASGAPPEVAKQIKDATDEIADLRSKLKTAQEAHVAERQQRAEADVFAQLGALLEDAGAGNLRKTFAVAKLADPKVRERVKVELDDDGEPTITVLQAGKRIPIAAADDTPAAMLKALAIELREEYKRTEPIAIKADVEPGAGVVSLATGAENEYDAAKEGREMAARQKGETDRSKGLAFT